MNIFEITENGDIYVVDLGELWWNKCRHFWYSNITANNIQLIKSIIIWIKKN